MFNYNLAILTVLILILAIKIADIYSEMEKGVGE